jgi:hypothetical protein
MAKRKRTNNDLQNTTQKTTDRETRAPLQPGCAMCLGSAGSSCSTSGTLRIALVTNPVICDEWGKYRDVRTTSGTYPWSLVTQIFRNGQLSISWRSYNFRSDDFKLANSNPWFISFLVSNNPLFRKSWQEPQPLGYLSSREIYTPCTGGDEMLLHINGKFTMRIFKSSVWS